MWKPDPLDACAKRKKWEESIGKCEFLKSLLDSRPRGEDVPAELEPPYLKIVAPMVRYSKLPFRLLCRKWGADLCYTPMIIAEPFNRSEKARDSEFSTNYLDRPLGVQFATPSPIEFSQAILKVQPYAQCVDLNCGCPQKWAMKEGIGSAMIEKPEDVFEMVKAAKQVSNIPVTVKIRLRSSISKTIDLVKQAEMAGVDWITVHGRTPYEKATPVHFDQIKQIKDCASVPIIANGDVFTPADAEFLVNATGVDGVMAARGILLNPAQFKGYDQVPMECVTDYLRIAMEYGGDYAMHHYHLYEMMSPYLTKTDRSEFTNLTSMSGVVDFFRYRGMI